MALVAETLRAQLEADFKAIALGDDDAAAKVAASIATRVDAYIKTATVTVAPGIPVATAGGPAAQTGATTAPGSAVIS
jgi:hypothetical protein